jgi:hypothetical protein
MKSLLIIPSNLLSRQTFMSVRYLIQKFDTLEPIGFFIENKSVGIILPDLDRSGILHAHNFWKFCFGRTNRDERIEILVQFKNKPKNEKCQSKIRFFEILTLHTSFR